MSVRDHRRPFPPHVHTPHARNCSARKSRLKSERSLSVPARRRCRCAGTPMPLRRNGDAVAPERRCRSTGTVVRCKKDAAVPPPFPVFGQPPPDPIYDLLPGCPRTGPFSAGPLEFALYIRRRERSSWALWKWKKETTEDTESRCAAQRRDGKWSARPWARANVRSVGIPPRSMRPFLPFWRISLRSRRFGAFPPDTPVAIRHPRIRLAAIANAPVPAPPDGKSLIARRFASPSRSVASGRHVEQQLRRSPGRGDEQIIACARTGHIQQIALGIVDFL